MLQAVLLQDFTCCLNLLLETSTQDFLNFLCFPNHLSECMAATCKFCLQGPLGELIADFASCSCQKKANAAPCKTICFFNKITA